MEVTISQDIVDKTTLCLNGFACLSGQWEPCGVVTGIIEGKLLALDVDQNRKKSCNYGVLFGKGFFCTCPTGVEVLKRSPSATEKSNP